MRNIRWKLFKNEERLVEAFGVKEGRLERVCDDEDVEFPWLHQQSFRTHSKLFTMMCLDLRRYRLPDTSDQE